MAERFTNLFRLNSIFVLKGCPVVIEAGALLKDNKTGNVLAQLKLLNLSLETVKAVKVHFDVKDAMNASVKGPDDFQYNDVNCLSGQSFGTQTPIPFPDPNSRSFSVVIIAVAFMDGTVWKNESMRLMDAFPQCTYLEEMFNTTDLIEQYRRETNRSANYIPRHVHGFWTCSCGTINNTPACRSCGISKSRLDEVTDIEYIQSALNERLEKERAAEEERRARLKAEAEEKARIKKEKDDERFLNVVNILDTSTSIDELETAKKAYDALLVVDGIQRDSSKKEEYERKIARLKKKKKNKTVFLTSAIGICAALIVIGVIVAKTIIIPSAQYRKANQLVQEGDYISARAIYETLDYKDSQSLYKEYESPAVYQSAKEAQNEGEYKKAMDLFAGIDYEDSAHQKSYCEKMIHLNSFQSALDSSDYDLALDELTKAKSINISDLNKELDADYYSLAEKAYGSNQIEIANKALYSIGDASLIDEELKNSIDEAFAKKKEEEERKAREKLIEESYKELIDSGVTPKNIKRVDELFEIIPNDYKDISAYRNIYEFYKPYIGTYVVDGYNVEYTFRLTDLNGDADKWVAVLGDRTSGGIFEYPNLSRVYADKYDGTWTISGNIITHVYTGARQFTSIYRKQ